jgi:hypothetical protein
MVIKENWVNLNKINENIHTLWTKMIKSCTLRTDVKNL